MRLFEPRILGSNSGVNFFGPMFSNKKSPLKNSPSRNSPPKIHIKKFTPELGLENSHYTSAGPFADLLSLCFSARFKHMIYLHFTSEHWRCIRSVSQERPRLLQDRRRQQPSKSVAKMHPKMLKTYEDSLYHQTFLITYQISGVQKAW